MLKPYLNFIHIPKSAGNSIKKFFVDLSGISGVNYRRIVPKTANVLLPNNQQFVTYGHGYPYKDGIEPKDCFSFAFVRNPYDRLVSVFFYMKAGGNQMKHELKVAEQIKNWDFQGFVTAIKQKELSLEHTRPQTSFIDNNIDFIGRYENLEEDFNKVLVLNNLAYFRDLLEHQNQSQHNNYREYYDENLISVVQNLYKTDLEKFNYDF